MKAFLTGFIATILVCGTYYMLAPKPVYKNVTVTVQSGDTMYGIAAKYAVDGEDVREVIYRAEEATGLRSSSLIQPGDKIIVPVKIGER